jgi:hypothetical protein
MDKPPGKREEGNGGEDQRRAHKEPSVKADHQNSDGQEQHESETTEKLRDKENPWQKVCLWFTPDRVQAGSAVVQAICAAALVVLTIKLWLVTRDYSGYTALQARAEATSASAAQKAADAEATSARAEATAAANESRTLTDEEAQVQGTVNGEHWDGNTDWIVVAVKNYGRTPAYRIAVNYNIRAYLPPISGEEADLFKTIGDRSGWSGIDKFPGIEGGDSRAMSDPISFTAAGVVAVKASQGTWGAGGFITYYDALGNKYVSDFCMTRDKSGTTPSYCSGHNDPDVPPAKRPKHRH